MKVSVVLAMVVLAARAASAQTIVNDQPPPTVNVGAAIGMAGRYLGFDWPSSALLSAQFPVSRFLVVEATATQWSWGRKRFIPPALADEHWKTTSAGANLLLRAGRGRLAGSIGMGAGLQRSSLQGSDCVKDCDAATFASSAVRTSPSLQFAGAADVRIAPRLVAFTSLLMIVGNEGALGVFGGLRVPVSSRTYHTRLPELFPTASAVRFEGERVRLTAADGSRQKGRLLSLSLSEVVLSTDTAIMHVPLQDVLRLEKTSTKGLRMGALIGTGAGIYAGLGAGEVGSPGGGEIWPVFVFSAVGAGIGAGIGIVIDAVRADRHLIYLAQGPGRSIGIKPFATRSGSGLELAMRW